MGNVGSSLLCREEDLDFAAYVAEEWRSQRARDLDKLGGQCWQASCMHWCLMLASNKFRAGQMAYSEGGQHDVYPGIPASEAHGGILLCPCKG